MDGIGSMTTLVPRRQRNLVIEPAVFVPTAVDTSDVTGNNAYFNNVLVKGSPVGGAVNTDFVTATTKISSPQWDWPSAGAGVTLGVSVSAQPGLFPLNGSMTLGDNLRPYFQFYMYGFTQYHNFGTPSASPPVGATYYYVKSDSRMYYKDSAGVELAVGAGIALNAAAQSALTEIENATTAPLLKAALVAFILAVAFTPTPPEEPSPIPTPVEV